MNSRKYDICNSDVHRASQVKQLTSKKHLELINENEMFIPEKLLKNLVKIKLRNYINLNYYNK